MKNRDKSAQIISALQALADDEKKIVLPRFFKTGAGEYGEGDKFIGVVVPNIRSVAKQFRDVDFETIGELLQSPWHEVRMCALLLLVDLFKREKGEGKKMIYQYYLSHTATINNWDLVDLTAPNIVGEYLLDKRGEEREVLQQLAKSSNLWEQRIAVVSTLTFIRHNDYEETFRLAEMLLNHPHDLMHKAIGWMLREVGKRNEPLLKTFLDQYASTMPRTMLRYAIEKFAEDERQYYLKSTSNRNKHKSK